MGYVGEQKRQYQREWMADRRARFFSDKVCARCGSRENLELDHIDPKQKVSHHIWSWSAERRAGELAKCQVLCRTHHLEKNQEQYFYCRRKPPPEHATKRMYRSGCRCELCCEAMRQYFRDRRSAVKRAKIVE